MTQHLKIVDSGVVTMDKKERSMYIALIVGLVLVGGYSYISQQSVVRDLNGKLNTMENNLAMLLESLGTEVDDVKRNLSLEVMIVENQLDSLRDSTNNRITTLTDVVDDIQVESDQELDALKRDLAAINVEGTDFSAVVEDVLPGIVNVQTDVGLGSGAIIRKDGYIVTNYHVIRDASVIRVVKKDDNQFAARLVDVDVNADIAVLKISGNHKELWFADARAVKVGEKVIALGNPLGLSFTVTEGIVSATNRVLPNGISYVQTDVPINPGNSGGPLMDKNGRIVGINNFKISGFEGIGFAIESEVVEGVVDGIVSADEAAQT